MFFFFFQAEDGIRDLVRSRGLGDVYKRQKFLFFSVAEKIYCNTLHSSNANVFLIKSEWCLFTCLLYTSDAADERSSVDLGGRRIIKKKTQEN